MRTQTTNQTTNMPVATVAVAFLATPHFSWCATGHTKTHAVSLVMGAWRTHAEQHDLDPNYVTTDDVNFVEGPVGTAYRDYTPVEIRPAGHSTHTDAEHTRDAEAIGHTTRDAQGLMLCNGCCAPTYLCQVDGNYHHVDPILACIAISAEA
jgi:hypothetical protein